MNSAATLEKMKAMKLLGMAHAFEEAMKAGIRSEYTPDELIAHLIESEYDDRYNRSLTRRLRLARMRHQARFEEISFNAERDLNKSLLRRLHETAWIRSAENVIITGKTGAGKSFIACALGHSACVNGFRVRYWNCMKLFSALKLAKADGSYQNEILRMARQDVLILDDFGLEMLDTQNRLMLLEILEDRIGRASTIVVSQLPVKAWHGIIGEPTIADAICDRLIHSAHIVDIDGDSMRRKTKRS